MTRWPGPSIGADAGFLLGRAPYCACWKWMTSWRPFLSEAAGNPGLLAWAIVMFVSSDFLF